MCREIIIITRVPFESIIDLAEECDIMIELEKRDIESVIVAITGIDDNCLCSVVSDEKKRIYDFIHALSV